MIDYMDTKRLEYLAEGYTYWFTKDSKRFFASRIGDTAYLVKDRDGSEYAYFVSSEKMGFEDTRRCWTVRCLQMIAGARHWHVKDIGDKGQYSNGKAAHKAMVAAAEAHDQASGAPDQEAWYKLHVTARDDRRRADALKVLAETEQTL